jgi:hypothetical protein
MRNRGNVTESLARGAATLSLSRSDTRIARLQAEPRDLRPRTAGMLRFVYRGPARGSATARIEVEPDDSGRLVRRRFRVRL